MGCASSAPESAASSGGARAKALSADSVSVSLSDSAMASGGSGGNNSSNNSSSGNLKKAGSAKARTRARASFIPERADANLLDFLAHQMGETTDPLHNDSLAEQFNQIFRAVFGPVWNVEQLPARRLEGMDTKLLAQLQKLFAMGPTTSRDMIRWKHAFKIQQRTPADALELRGDVVSTHLQRCSVAHAFAALGLARSLEFVLDSSAVHAQPKRSGNTMWLSPMDLALMYDRVPVAALLADKYGVDPLQEFHEEGAFAPRHVSGISCAAGNGSLAAVKFLLERGADPNAAERTRGGANRDAAVLHVAISRALNDYRGVACALLDGGAELEVGVFTVKSSTRDKVLESPLMTAARVRDVELVTELLRRGASADFRNELTGESVLQEAVGVPGNVGVLRALLDACDPAAPLEPDSRGVTPLMVAKDGVDADDGANFRVLSFCSKKSFSGSSSSSGGSRGRRSLPAGDALLDAPLAPDAGLDASLGDRVRLRVGYEEQRKMKGALREGEPFWAVVVAHSHVRKLKQDEEEEETLDVVIDDVLALACEHLGGANFGDTLIDVPLRKIFEVRPASRGSVDDFDVATL